MWFVIHVLGLDIAYLYTKFDHRWSQPFRTHNFRRYDWCPPKFKWLTYVTWPRPFQRWFVIRGLALASIDVASAYQIWSLYLHLLRRYEKRYKMWKMGRFVVVMGHSMSLCDYTARSIALWCQSSTLLVWPRLTSLVNTASKNSWLKMHNNWPARMSWNRKFQKSHYTHVVYLHAAF